MSTSCRDQPVDLAPLAVLTRLREVRLYSPGEVTGRDELRNVDVEVDRDLRT